MRLVSCRRNLRAGFGFGESAFKHEGEQFRAVTIKTRSPCVIFVLSREDFFAITEVQYSLGVRPCKLEYVLLGFI